MMLSAMRNNRRVLAIILWLVIIAFVSTIFVVWGIGSRENQSTYVATVNGEHVGYDEYRNYYDETVQSLRQVFGDAYDDYAKNVDLDKIILSELINRKLLLEEARRLGVPATDFEVVEAIKIVPAFQTNGQFDSQQYVQVLNYYRQTPAVFEKSIRDSILVEKLQSIVKNGEYAVSDTAAMNEYNYRNMKAALSYFAIPISDFIGAAEPSIDNLTAYYNENKEQYRLPAKLKLKYVTFDKNAFSAEDVVINPADIERYYNDNAVKYSVEESVVLRDIIIRVSDWNKSEEVTKAKTKAEAAIAELKKGAKYEDVAKKYSDREFNAQGGLLGTVTKGQLEPVLENAVFALAPGAFSEIIISPSGFNIAKVDKKTPAHIITLAEATPGINDTLKSERMNSAYRTYLLGIYKDILKAGNITAYIVANPESKLIPSTTEFFSEAEVGLPVFMSLPNIKRSLFALGKTELSQIVEDGSVSYLFEIEDKIDSVIPPMADIQVAVSADYKLSAAKIDALLAIKNTIAKDGFAKAAKDFKAKVTKSGEFKRDETDAIFSYNADLINAVFKSKPGAALANGYIIGDKVYAVNVDSIIPPLSDGFADEKAAIVSYIRSVKSEEAVASYLESLRAKAKIVINPAFQPEAK